MMITCFVCTIKNNNSIVAVHKDKNNEVVQRPGSASVLHQYSCRLGGWVGDEAII